MLLDDLDKELERRGHHFCRYADDCNVYVRSEKAAKRVMASVTTFLQNKLKLRVNRGKSKVARPWEHKFLGYTVTAEKRPRHKVSAASIKGIKGRIRQITKRGRGRNIRAVIGQISTYLRGWIGYYRLNDVKWIFKALDRWIRRRLRKILWQQGKTPRTRAKKLRSLGLSAEAANKGAYSRRGPWRNAATPAMHEAVTNERLAQWGLISLFEMQRCLTRVT